MKRQKWTDLHCTDIFSSVQLISVALYAPLSHVQMSNLSTQQVACLSNKKSHLATSCAMLHTFNLLSNLLPKQYNSPKQATCLDGALLCNLVRQSTPVASAWWRVSGTIGYSLLPLPNRSCFRNGHCVCLCADYLNALRWYFQSRLLQCARDKSIILFGDDMDSLMDSTPCGIKSATFSPSIGRLKKKTFTPTLWKICNKVIIKYPTTP